MSGRPRSSSTRSASWWRVSASSPLVTRSVRWPCAPSAPTTAFATPSSSSTTRTSTCRPHFPKRPLRLPGQGATLGYGPAMSSEVDHTVVAAPADWRSRLKQIGPGIMAAATGVGAGDLVATMVAGSKYGYTLLWAVIIGTVFKLALGEAVGRWHLMSGQTILSGWRTLGKWALWYFGVYAVVWGFVYGATAMSASGLPLNAMFPFLSVRYWAMLCGLAGFALVWFGRYAFLEKVMTALVGVMFVTVVGTAVLVAPNLGDVASGLVPRLPDGSLVYVLGLVGGVGGTITMAAYGYWTIAKGWRGPS